MRYASYKGNAVVVKYFGPDGEHGARLEVRDTGGNYAPRAYPREYVLSVEDQVPRVAVEYAAANNPAWPSGCALAVEVEPDKWVVVFIQEGGCR